MTKLPGNKVFDLSRDEYLKGIEADLTAIDNPEDNVSVRLALDLYGCLYDILHDLQQIKTRLADEEKAD